MRIRPALLRPRGIPPWGLRQVRTKRPQQSAERRYEPLAWRRRTTPANVVWRSEPENRLPNQSSGYEAVELHLVPVGDDGRLQVRDLTSLAHALPAHGRQHGTFTAVDALDVRTGGTEVVVTSAGRGTVAGLAVTRSGQRSIWAGLPRDMLGAVLDEEDLAGQLANMLATLVELPIPAPELMVPAVGIEPARMVSAGKVSDLPRSSASLGHGMPAHIRPPADDAVTFAALRAHRDDVAVELAARLVAEHKTAARIG